MLKEKCKKNKKLLTKKKKLKIRHNLTKIVNSFPSRQKLS